MTLRFSFIRSIYAFRTEMQKKPIKNVKTSPRAVMILSVTVTKLGAIIEFAHSGFLFT